MATSTETDITITTSTRRVVLWYLLLLGMVLTLAYVLGVLSSHILSAATGWVVALVAVGVLWIVWARPRIHAKLELHGSILTDTILSRTMDLENLASVQHFADRSGEFFYLRDRQGKLLLIQMSYFQPEQLALLFRAMRLYVLSEDVEQKRALGAIGVTCDVWFSNYLNRYSPEA